MRHEKTQQEADCLFEIALGEDMKDQFKKATSKTQAHIAANGDLYRGAVGGIFIGAGLMAFFRKQTRVTALVLVKVDAK